ncbi:Six-hairpin glycosidase [Gymnopus androsaceus JB14]|uniref:alpha,alpha-trehalase n=1 Tax=Gymnopus androsaceus JB14 TaxID=1447944 RepID=A0A6A4GLG6_9AGAR|nr:Six-hairpin glycosidase [Gymnopus androsaceus JB14]
MDGSLMLWPLLLTSPALSIAPAGPWDAFNFAPSDRTAVTPKLSSRAGNLLGNATTTDGATFSGNGSYVVLDFDQEVGGRLTFQIDSTMSASTITLSFTESPVFISPTESDTSFLSIPTPLSANETFTQTVGDQRGGFRFLTIASTGDVPVTISNLTLNSTFMPQLDDLTAYSGYFYAKDTTGFHDPDFLTKLWYGGAYTVQMNTIDVHEARQQPCPLPTGWANNATGSSTALNGTILVDGAKEIVDAQFLLRNVWPGDMGISTHTELVSTFDLLSSKNSLLVLYSGPPINAMGSDTYISWSLIGTHTVYLYTGDLDFVQQVWANYTFALAFLQVKDNGQGHNSAANALLYETLITAAELATALGSNASLAEAYAANASSVKVAYNELLWDESAGLFKDNDTSTLHPQDGNSLAVLFNVTNNASQIQSISDGLTQFWTPIGPLSPELNDTIIPFIGGFELQAHFIAGQGECALDLLHREWGYRSAARYNFDHSDTSHAHGWATGPTPALIFFVVGLTVTLPQGATWSVAPVLSGLSAAEGGFETGLGWFGANWTVADNTTFTLMIDTPSGTNGTVTLPASGEVEVDGMDITVNRTQLDLAGGSHVIVLQM